MPALIDESSGGISIEFGTRTPGLIVPVAGRDGTSITIAGTVATYANLPADLDVGDKGSLYIVAADGLGYVWSGTAWPADGAGVAIQGPEGRGYSSVTISGNDLLFAGTDSVTDTVTVPALTDAAAAATAAQGYAATATTQAGNAAVSATAASGSATAAAGSATTASGHAADAASSATAASGSAATATTQAGNAAASATAASGSATAAANSATAASESATTAAASATTASNHATTASGHAATATTQASTATSSASIAAGHATDAENSAIAAAQSAQDAADVVNSGIPNANSTTKGGIMLAGDLAGTYDAPTVPGLASKLDQTAVDARVSAGIANWVNGAPAALDTLNELAAALGDDPNFATTVSNQLGTKAPLASPALTGSPTINSKAVVVTDDSRLSDARTPTAHNHPATQISDSTTVGRAVLTASDAATARSAIGAGTSSLTIGTTGTTACAGNDTRLSDTRTPSDNSVTSAKIVDGAIVNADINASAGIALSKLAAGYLSGIDNAGARTLTLWVGTEAQYSAIGTKDGNTLYFRSA